MYSNIFLSFLSTLAHTSSLKIEHNLCHNNNNKSHNNIKLYCKSRGVASVESGSATKFKVLGACPTFEGNNKDYVSPVPLNKVRPNC